jgi:hypothetical protein
MNDGNSLGIGKNRFRVLTVGIVGEVIRSDDRTEPLESEQAEWWPSGMSHFSRSQVWDISKLDHLQLCDNVVLCDLFSPQTNLL